MNGRFARRPFTRLQADLIDFNFLTRTSTGGSL